MEKEFNVIEIKISDDVFGNYSYEYVSQITTDNVGNIKITKSDNIFEAMKFNNWVVYDGHENKIRKQLLEFVKSYYSKYKISYHTVKLNY